jgi:murein L,D-transpeptidase YafK
VQAVVTRLGPIVRARVAPYFAYARLAYPPTDVAFVAFKRERRLEIWARDDGDAEGPPSPWRRVDARPILAASGGPGPKLVQGDRQVPEGIYRLVAFNPNSRFHLSMMIDYPNAFDLAAAAEDGRVYLGGDIFIHGDARSIGCLAMGDRGIEDLFVLVADVGLDRVQVVIAPWDSRGGVPLAPVPGLSFTGELYRQITERLAEFPAPVPTVAP